MAADFNVRPPTAHTTSISLKKKHNIYIYIYVENCIDKESVEKIQKQQPEPHMQIKFASQRFSFLAKLQTPKRAKIKPRNTK